MRFFLRFFAAGVVLASLAACSLPRGAAGQAEVLRDTARADADVAVYTVDRALLAKMADWPHPDRGRFAGWIAHRGRGGGVRIAPGDRLNLAIWDSGQNSLLAAPGQKAVPLDGVEVAPDGTIFVPYLDRIKVAGLTPVQARQTIQGKLGAIIASAQVQLSLRAGRGNSVDLVGGVERAGSYPLAERDLTVLGLLSLGGGIPAPLRNPQIRLLREGQVHAISAARLYDDPRLDTVLRGGDKVIVQEDKRYFLALGAAGHENQIPFRQDRVSALDAVSMIGGVSQTRGDPGGVLILRHYSPRAGRPGPSKARVVFAVDLTHADGLFSAGQFRIMPGDVVLVTESPVTSVRTIFGLIGQALGISRRL